MFVVNVQYTYPFLKKATIEFSRKSYYDGRTLRINHFKNCYALPYKALKNNNSNNIIGGGLIVPQLFQSIGTIYECENNCCEHIGCDAIFIGYMCSTCWGHTITDSFARLWWVVKESDRLELDNMQIFYYGEENLTGNYLEIIKLLGISEDRLHYIKSVTHFDSVFVPDVCFDNLRMPIRYTKEYVSLIDRLVLRSFVSEKYSKIFLMKANSKRQICSEEIRQIITAEGYLCINPEQLSVDKQICIFQNAQIIISEEGSLSHNCIFCKEGTKIILLRKANSINIYQTIINQIRKLDVTYIDCNLSILNNPQHPHRGPFFLFANENFCNYFNCNKRPFPYDEFYNYLKNCIKPSNCDKYKLDYRYSDIINTTLKN